MEFINDIETLEAQYPRKAGELALRKVAHALTPLYRRWIMGSRFVVLSTVGAGGTDGSPRGDDGPTVLELDPQTLAMPDWRGNNRLDSLRNIVADGRVSLMFMVPGSTNVVRVNGDAKVTADASLRARFARGDKQPATVIVIRIGEVYFQCAKAILRSGLWSGEDESGLVPTAGELIREFKPDHEAEAYDAGYPEHAKSLYW